MRRRGRAPRRRRRSRHLGRARDSRPSARAGVARARKPRARRGGVPSERPRPPSAITRAVEDSTRGEGARGRRVSARRRNSYLAARFRRARRVKRQRMLPETTRKRRSRPSLPRRPRSASSPVASARARSRAAVSLAAACARGNSSPSSPPCSRARVRWFGARGFSSNVPRLLGADPRPSAAAEARAEGGAFAEGVARARASAAASRRLEETKKNRGRPRRFFARWPSMCARAGVGANGAGAGRRSLGDLAHVVPKVTARRTSLASQNAHTACGRRRPLPLPTRARRWRRSPPCPPRRGTRARTSTSATSRTRARDAFDSAAHAVRAMERRSRRAPRAMCRR